jgi:glucans biosynthesis protein
MRLHLTLAVITAVALVISLRAGARHPFTYAHLQELAETRAHAPYVPLPDVLPPQLEKLTPDQDRGIFWKDTYRLWRKDALLFQVDFYHQLNSNPQPHIAPQINAVGRKRIQQLAYSPRYFNFIDLKAHPPVPLVFDPPLPTNLGYAGFYVRYPDMAIKSNPSSPLDGFFSVLGSNYFRVLAKSQVYGLSARGIAINTSVNKKPEEFPNFREWWLQQPGQNATELVLDALLDGPSVSGAYEFRIRPGAVTSVDIHATLFFRQAVDRLGIAPFSSMYLFGENAKDHLGDTGHPEIHDSDGVLVNTGAGEWIWRPLGQATQLQYYNFMDDNPKGFGLLQRDRDFQHYQDLDMNYNVRPSAWVTPHGDWGKGAIQLIHRPSNDVNTDNVVLFWHPDQPIKAGDRMDISYTLDFYMNDATRPPLAYCKQTLINSPAPPPPASPIPPPAPVVPVTPAAPSATTNANPKVSAPPAPVAPKKSAKPAKTAADASKTKTVPPIAPPQTPPPSPNGTVPVQFLVDFMGNGIDSIPAGEPPSLDLNYGPAGTILREKKVEKNAYDNSWRVTFTIIPAKHNVPTELRCRLVNHGKPLTETWTYTWHQ